MTKIFKHNRLYILRSDPCHSIIREDDMIYKRELKTLANCKTTHFLQQKHHGGWSAESEDNQSCFFFFFPPNLWGFY